MIWLASCHETQDAIEQVSTRFERILNLLGRSGPSIGMPMVRKVHGYDNLWEMRVKHPTGAYRLFFGIRGRRIAVSWGASKTAETFSPAVYRKANEKVQAHLAALA